MKNQALSRCHRIAVTSCAATVLLALIIFLGSTATAQSTNGSAGQMPAYYDSKLLTINLMLLPAGTEGCLIPASAEDRRIAIELLPGKPSPTFAFLNDK